MALQEAERELEAATKRTTVNAAAKKLQRARAELKRLEAEPAESGQSDDLPAVTPIALPHNALVFFDLKA